MANALKVDVLVAVPGLALPYSMLDHNIHKFVFGGGFGGVAQLLCHVCELSPVGCADDLAGVFANMKVVGPERE
ncbi:hypothetical protein [Corynebacterium tuberculostearicum]|uniref:hypothetical protein n=1 Tax=Corynebacterium tuberculostearicum TaxID=38304 RepID=UPI00265D35BD|nr:hypothetical protein [Corynebacterium tuberculostearicum]WKE58572.1 hypothetical protein J8247_11875 [Corynebacterium tuberculostearicum]